MNFRFVRIVAAVLCLSVLLSACENLSPGENAAVFGVAAGLATGIPLGVAGVNPAITIPVTAGAAVAAGAIAYVVAKHQASERQRKIAEQRARLYMAKQEEERKKAAQTASASSKKKKSRYIAVKTVKESNSQGKEQVMIFDTQSNEVVGNDVYDLKSAPKVGQTSKFDTYTAEYVGTGS